MTRRLPGEFTISGKIVCAMYGGVSLSHSPIAIRVGTVILAGSYIVLPEVQNSAVSATVPFGARTTGGFCLAPTGSVAQVASAHCSNQPGGMSAAFLSSGTPFSHRALACSRVTVRYAPSGPPPGATKSDGVGRTQPGAYCPRRTSLPGFWMVVTPISAHPQAQP